MRMSSEDEQERKTETTAPTENPKAKGTETKPASFNDRMAIGKITNDDQLAGEQRRPHPKSDSEKICDPFVRGKIADQRPDGRPPRNIGDPLEDQLQEPQVVEKE